jgi:hypothetical protein
MKYVKKSGHGVEWIKTFTKGVMAFAKFRLFFAKVCSRKPQSREKCYKRVIKVVEKNICRYFYGPSAQKVHPSLKVDGVGGGGG